MTGNDPRIGKNHLTSPPARIEVSIDELVLYSAGKDHLFKSADRYRISEALTAELTRLFTERWVTGKPDFRASAGKPDFRASAHSSGTLTQLDHDDYIGSIELVYLNAGSFQVAQDASPEKIGAQVAAALWESGALGEPVAPEERGALQEDIKNDQK